MTADRAKVHDAAVLLREALAQAGNAQWCRSLLTALARRITREETFVSLVVAPDDPGRDSRLRLA